MQTEYTPPTMTLDPERRSNGARNETAIRYCNQFAYRRWRLAQQLEEEVDVLQDALDDWWHTYVHFTAQSRNEVRSAIRRTHMRSD